MSVYLATLSRCCLTCIASSLVGANMRASRGRSMDEELDFVLFDVLSLVNQSNVTLSTERKQPNSSSYVKRKNEIERFSFLVYRTNIT